jgi:hypothetical protein
VTAPPRPPLFRCCRLCFSNFCVLVFVRASLRVYMLLSPGDVPRSRVCDQGLRGPVACDRRQAGQL